jgi:aminoglycoside phosphotransferase (APT) family kinase protein
VGIVGGELTSTGSAIIKLGTGRGELCVVVKLAMTPAAADALTRETAIMTALHRQAALSEWCELLPRALVTGERRGHAYRIDSALDGSAPPARSLNTNASGSLLAAAADAITALHAATAAVVRVDSAALERWVDAPLRELTKPGLTGPAARLRLEHLRAELYEALEGRRFSAGWIHGDYWLGNLLVSPGVPAPVISGIVDWEAAAPGELPLHDLLHLIVSTQRLRTGAELGRIIRDRLGDYGWTSEERLLVERHACRDADELSPRHALLLYWLRHLAVHVRQQGPAPGWRFRWWQQRNLLPVLGLLWP